MDSQRDTLLDEDRLFSDPLETIKRTADGTPGLSVPELRERIDMVHRFLVERFIPHSQADAELIRLADKLTALRERLQYSYFGPAQLRALQAVLYDLHELIELHLAREDEFYLTLLGQATTAAQPSQR